MQSKNYYNQLIDCNCDYKEENFKNSLKFNHNGLYFNKLLNEISKNNIDFDIKNGFDYKSKDKNISEFKKITLEMNNNNFNKFEENFSDINYNYNKDTFELFISI